MLIALTAMLVASGAATPTASLPAAPASANSPQDGAIVRLKPPNSKQPRAWWAYNNVSITIDGYYTSGEIADPQMEAVRLKHARSGFFSKPSAAAMVVSRTVRWFPGPKDTRCAEVLYGLAEPTATAQQRVRLAHAMVEQARGDEEDDQPLSCSSNGEVLLRRSDVASDEGKLKAISASPVTCAADRRRRITTLRVSSETRFTVQTRIDPSFARQQGAAWLYGHGIGLGAGPGIVELFAHRGLLIPRVTNFSAPDPKVPDQVLITQTLAPYGTGYCVTLTARQGARVWSTTLVRPHRATDPEHSPFWFAKQFGDPRYWNPTSDIAVLSGELNDYLDTSGDNIDRRGSSQLRLSMDDTDHMKACDARERETSATDHHYYWRVDGQWVEITATRARNALNPGTPRSATRTAAVAAQLNSPARTRCVTTQDASREDHELLPSHVSVVAAHGRPARQVAEELGVSRAWVYEVWRLAGLEPDSKTRDTRAAEIKRARADRRAAAVERARALKAEVDARAAVQEAARLRKAAEQEAEVARKRKVVEDREALHQAILALHGLPTSEVAGRLGVRPNLVSGVWSKAGLRGPGRRALGPGQLEAQRGITGGEEHSDV